MQFNMHFMGTKTNQSIVCDSRGNFGFSKLNAIWRPGFVMQFGWGFIDKNQTFAKDKCAEGKSGDDIQQEDCKSKQNTWFSSMFELRFEILIEI